MRKYPLLLFLFLLLFQLPGFSQTRTLTGVVKDSKTNDPLVAATVTVKGKRISTSTAADGSFTLTVPAGNIELNISYIGYNNISVPVDATQADINVALEQGTNTATDVVVTALGISKESKKVGYAVSTVNGDLLNKARETNVALSLEGRVAGLNITGTNSGPGSSAKILLRGITSFSQGGSPLFVINGVPMDNSQRGSTNEWGGSDQGDGIANINPDDIETMTVLKGSSASALYGTRAANGVILITTKSAKKGTTTVEINSNNTVDRAIDYTDFQKQYGQGESGARPANSTDALTTTRTSWGEKFDGQPTIQFNEKTYPYSPVSDNIHDFYRNAVSSTNTVSVGAGGENSTVRLSLSNLYAQSIVRNSTLTRSTVNLNTSQTIWNKLTVSLLANYVDEQSTNKSYLSDGPLNPNNGIFLAPNIKESIFSPGYDPASPKGAETLWTDDIYVTNPYFVINRAINNVGRKRLISAVTAKYNFTDWLYLQGRIGWDILNDRYFQVNPTGLAYSQDLLGSLGNLSTNSTKEFNPDVLIGAKRNITDDINFDLSVGASLRKRRFENIGVSGGPFNIPFLYSPYNVKNFGRTYSFAKREAHSAYYSLDLSYKSILTLTTTGRYDTYSTLPSSNRDIFTPSVAGSFVFTDLLNSPLISFGKLRASYSKTSGEPATEYITQQYYSVGNPINGITTGSFSGSLPNLFLKPFTLKEVEVGGEVKFLKNRLGLDIAYYQRKTKNEILNAALSPTTGYTNQYIGTGSTLNKGLELAVTASPVQSRDFTWNVTFNFTNVANKILRLYDESSTVKQQNTGGTYRPLNANLAWIIGKPGPQIIAHDWARDSATGQIIVDALGVPTRASALTPAGSTLPKYYGGLNNEFTYKKFNLAFLIDYKFGNKVLSATQYYSVANGLNKITLEHRDADFVVDGVTADGAKNTTPISAESYWQAYADASQHSVLNGSFIKLRQVTLGYTLDNFGRLPIQSITLSLVGRNLACLLKHTDNIDPEAGFSAVASYSGIEGTSLPSTRTFGINANIKFKK